MRRPPSRNITRYRGDWLIEALIAIARGQGVWNNMPTGTNPSGEGSIGRFHEPTQQYWPEARMDTGIHKPRYRLVRVPKESLINYPGENIAITPTWVRRVHAALDAEGAYDAFRDHARSDNGHPVVILHRRNREVTFNGFHRKELHHACLIVSDLTPYTPIIDEKAVASVV